MQRHFRFAERRSPPTAWCRSNEKAVELKLGGFLDFLAAKASLPKIRSLGSRPLPLSAHTISYSSYLDWVISLIDNVDNTP